MDSISFLLRLIWNMPILGKGIAVLLGIYVVFVVMTETRKNITQQDRIDENRLFKSLLKFVLIASFLWFLGFLFSFNTIGIATRGIFLSFGIFFFLRLIQSIVYGVHWVLIGDPFEKRIEPSAASDIIFTSIIAWVIGYLLIKISIMNGLF